MPAPMTVAEKTERLVVIGNFDGVHLGHRAVVDHALAEAVSKGLRPAVLTFHPHPAEVLTGKGRPVLTALHRKRELLASLGEELEVIVWEFSRELAELTPEEFAREILGKHLAARVVVVGSNFRFGKKRSGDLQKLAELGQRQGFEARCEPLRGDHDGAFSSTRIRNLLGAGEVAEAARLLGRLHRFSGRVVEGDRRGRTLGFPTANLEEIVEMLPVEGAYCGWATVDPRPAASTSTTCAELPLQAPGSQRYPAVFNLGARPTVGRCATVEVHLLDFDGDLYGCALTVDVVERLRSVERFSSVEGLRRQIVRDVVCAREILGV